MEFCSCVSSNKIFSFYNDRTDYYAAVRKCSEKRPRQKIARFLTAADYQNFIESCHAGKLYWIGLEAHFTSCSNPQRRFRWNKRPKCVNESLLNININPNRGSCLSAFISPSAPKGDGLIRSGLANCTKTYGYICQRLNANTATTQTTAASSARQSAATEKHLLIHNDTLITSTAKLQMTESTNSFENSSENATTIPNIASLSKPEEVNSHDYSGTAIGGSVIVILLAFLIGFIYWKRFRSNKSTNASWSLFNPRWKLSRSTDTVHKLPTTNYAAQFFYTIERSNWQHDHISLNDLDEQFESPNTQELAQKFPSEKNTVVYNQTDTTMEINPYEIFTQIKSEDDLLVENSNNLYQSIPQAEEGKLYSHFSPDNDSLPKKTGYPILYSSKISVSEDNEFNQDFCDQTMKNDIEVEQDLPCYPHPEADKNAEYCYVYATVKKTTSKKNDCQYASVKKKGNRNVEMKHDDESD